MIIYWILRISNYLYGFVNQFYHFIQTVDKYQITHKNELFINHLNQSFHSESIQSFSYSFLIKMIEMNQNSHW